MSLEHFQSTLFQEIVHGIATSCEGYLLDAGEMIDSATKIYLALARAQAVEETRLQAEWIDQREVSFRKLVTCEKCGKMKAKFVGEEINFCQFCGRKVLNDD